MMVFENSMPVASLEATVLENTKKFGKFKEGRLPQGLAILKGHTVPLRRMLEILCLNNPTSNVFVKGPPGCGKTLMCRLSAEEVNYLLKSGEPTADRVRHDDPEVKGFVARLATTRGMNPIPEQVALYNFDAPATMDWRHDPVLFFDKAGTASQLRRDLETLSDALITRMREPFAPNKGFDAYVNQCEAQLRKEIEKPFFYRSEGSKGRGTRHRFRLNDTDDKYSFAEIVQESQENGHSNGNEEGNGVEEHPALLASFDEQRFAPAIRKFERRATVHAFAKQRPEAYRAMVRRFVREVNPLYRRFKMPAVTLEDMLPRFPADKYPDTDEKTIALYVGIFEEKWRAYPALVNWAHRLKETLTRPQIMELLDEDSHGYSDLRTFQFIRNVIGCSVLFDKNRHPEKFRFTELKSPTGGMLFGLAHHDSLNERPENMRLELGAAAMYHLLYVDEPKLDDTFINSLLTYLNSREVTTFPESNSDSTSSHIRLTVPGHATLVMSGNIDILEKHPGLKRRVETIELSGIQEANSDAIQSTADFMRWAIHNYNHEHHEDFPTPHKSGLAALVQTMSAVTGSPGRISKQYGYMENLVLLLAQRAKIRGLRTDEFDDSWIFGQLDEIRRENEIASEKRAEFMDSIMEMPSDMRLGTAYGVDIQPHGAVWPWTDYGVPILIQATSIPKGTSPDRMRTATRGTGLIGEDSTKGNNMVGDFLLSVFPDMPVEIGVTHADWWEYNDGPSASLVEALAAASRLTGVPLSQRVITTGTLNLYDGTVGGIGGISAKGEVPHWFYNSLHEKFLPGGSIQSYAFQFPVQNLAELELRLPALLGPYEAIKQGAFKLKPIRSFWEAFEYASGINLGQDPARELRNLAKQANYGLSRNLIT